MFEPGLEATVEERVTEAVTAGGRRLTFSFEVTDPPARSRVGRMPACSSIGSGSSSVRKRA